MRSIKEIFNDAVKKYMDYPKEVNIETTGRCNAKCVFCPHDSLERKNTQMEDVLFFKIISDLKEIPKELLYNISPFKVNEPLMDKTFFDKMEIINRELPNAYIRFFSNFNMATDEHIKRLFRIKNLSQIWISLNSMDNLEYKQLMGLNLDKTLENIDKLLRYKKNNGINKKIVISRVNDNTSNDNIFVDKLKARFKENMDQIKISLIPRGEWIDHNSFNKVTTYEKMECLRWFEISICCTGEVSFCCMDGKCEYSIGNVNNQSILEIYNNPKFKDLRKKSINRSLVEPCKFCTYD